MVKKAACVKTNLGNRFTQIFLMISIVFIIQIFHSCTSDKNIPYFKDLSDTSKPVLVNTVGFSYPKIQPDDLLNIEIETLDSGANAMFALANIPIASVGSNSLNMTGSQFVAGHLVDKQGDVFIPLIGKLHVAGLTTVDARELILEKVQKLYNSPSVEVRYSNFKITVMGEVNRPATYTIPNEKINILDAIGMAGDMTIFGRRENVLLIRDSAGAKELVRLNLNTKNIINSPYFYMRQNDVIYIQPNKSKIASLDEYRLRNYTIAAAALSVLIILATRVK